MHSQPFLSHSIVRNSTRCILNLSHPTHSQEINDNGNTGKNSKLDDANLMMIPGNVILPYPHTHYRCNEPALLFHTKAPFIPHC